MLPFINVQRTARPARGQASVRWIVSAAGVCVALALGAFTALHYLRPMVTVTEAVEAPVVQAFYSTGTIQPEREYPIRSNIAGVLKEVRVDKGARVTKGDVLAIVEDPALIFANAEAQAMLEERVQRADEATSPVLMEYASKLAADGEMLDIAKREQKRVTDLMERNAGSQTDLDRAMDRVKTLWSEIESLKAQRSAKVLEMKREVDVAQAALGAAKWNLEQQTLLAPIDGAVLDRPLAVRTRVAINDPVMKVADVTPAKLVMRAAVDEEDVTKVVVGQTVRMVLYSFADIAITGKVQRIYDQADADRRTFEIDVRLDNASDRLAPGMTGELAFVMAEKARAVVVPAQALQDGTIRVVRDGKLAIVRPTIGIRSVERIEVLDGIHPGDIVAISPVSAMSDGQFVRTSHVDALIASGINKPLPTGEAFKSFSK